MLKSLLSLVAFVIKQVFLHCSCYSPRSECISFPGGKAFLSVFISVSVLVLKDNWLVSI